MKRMRRGLAILLTALMLLSCCMTFALAEGAGFADVAVQTDLDLQEITVSGRLVSGDQRDLTVILKREDQVVYLNQFESEADGGFTHTIAASFESGDVFTLQLGGASAVEPYVMEIVVDEEAELMDVSAKASLSKQELSISGTVVPEKVYTLVMEVAQNDEAPFSVTFDTGADGTFSHKRQMTLKEGDKLSVTLDGEGIAAPFRAEITVENDRQEPSGGGGGSTTRTYTITAKAGEGGTITPTKKTVARNGSATFTVKADQDYEIEDVLVDGKSVGAVSTYTFEKVTANHTISAQFKKSEKKPEPAEWTNPFTDVAAGDWYYDAVAYVCGEGLFNGTDDTSFSPNTVMSRAMLVTVLHRMAGAPAGGENQFTDVEPNSWYGPAVSWAAAQGIVNGVGGDRFDPNGQVTREQIATILHRYAQKSGSVTGANGDLGQFTDGAAVSDFAVEAMKWAVGSGLISGKGNGILDPSGPATRAEVATLLARYAQM